LSFTVLILAIAAAYFFVPADQEPQKAADPAPKLTHANASQRGLTMPPSSAGIRRVIVEADGKAIEAADTVSGVGNGVSGNEGSDQAADSEKIADSHLPASTAVDGIDAALTKLSLLDLKSAAQRELARLGCYSAEVDGLWGPKSQSAVETFNQRSGGNWDNMPSPELVSALRSAPGGLCERTCSPSASGASCAVASADDDKEMPAYLPPWMRGEKLVGTEAAVIASETRTSASNAGQRPPRLVRQREWRRRYGEPRYRGRRSGWTPPGWPGTAN
jgi:hypothetical protein